jgi:CheY-like chemotaxis protein
MSGKLTETALRPKILLIDDDSFIISMLTFILTKTGYDITTAQNGVEAIAILSKESVDLIIVDLMMPEMDGFSFLQWLREEAKSSVPAVVLTAMSDLGTTDEALTGGASLLLAKPIKPAELLTAIQKILQLP